MQLSENCWTRISRKNNFNFQPTFKANNITLKNRFSIFDTKGGEFQFSSGKESTREPKKVNKRNTEYIPTFMYKMKENSKVHKKKTFAKPTDINVYEISVMEKIKENVKLNRSLTLLAPAYFSPGCSGGGQILPTTSRHRYG